MTVLNEDALGIGLIALADLDGDVLENLRHTRSVQRTVARMQISEVRRAREQGESWAAVADALGLSEDVASARFRPHLTEPA